MILACDSVELPMPKQIPLTNSTLFALVDDEHFDKVNKYSWYLVKGRHTNYACACMNNTSRYLHHYLFGRKKMFDHIDQNGLNNQQSNLRETNHSLNGANQPKRKGTYSQYKGVSWDKRRNKWTSGLTKNGYRYSYGYHATEVSAALAYNTGALQHFGEHACLNIIK